MAEVLDSPMSTRRVLNVRGLNSDMQRRSGACSPHSCGSASLGAGGKLEADPFDFNDSDDDDNKLSNKHGNRDLSVQRRQKENAKEIISNILMDQTSQQSFLSNGTASNNPIRSQQSEILTQNADCFTQMTQDDNDAINSPSPYPPTSPMKPQTVPWGRLMPCYGGKAVELLPRAPNKDPGPSSTTQQHSRGAGMYSLLGLEQLLPSDIFNEYSMGRSAKCDLVAHKPDITNIKCKAKQSGKHQKKEQRLMEWAYGLISNQHCRVYCTLPEDPKSVTMAGSTKLPASTMEVYVEDSSNNGTMVNQTTLLRRGQKRRLHSGDEISLVNAETLRKKIRDPIILQSINQKFSFVFVNVAHQQEQLKLQQSPKMKLGQSIDSMFPMPCLHSNPTSARRRRGLVNVRAMNYGGGRGQRAPAVATGDRSPFQSSNSSPLGRPTPKSTNGHDHPNSAGARDHRQVSSAMQLESPSLARRIEEDYDIRDLLGRGTCGEVRRAIHRRSGQERAVKIISLPSPGLLTNKQQEEAQQWQAEAQILQTLEHPYVVQLVDVFRTDTHLYLVMELCSGGDLFDRIIQTGKYTEDNSRRVMRRLLSAVHYIHEDCGIVHRDLKPENILLCGINDQIEVKITDFGVAKSASGDLKTVVGTPLYFPPEVLVRRHTVLGKGRYGKPADMWSLGIILFILLSGKAPYDVDGAAGMDVILQKSFKISFPPLQWASISAAAQDLVKRMLVKDPRKRISAREACDHPWILTEDGDTHRHPLEDPKLISVTKKRLFLPQSGSTTPTPVTTLASPCTMSERKRRKVSMESAGTSKSDTKMRDQAQVLQENNPQKDHSPSLDVLQDSNVVQNSPSSVETKCDAVEKDNTGPMAPSCGVSIPSEASDSPGAASTHGTQATATARVCTDSGIKAEQGEEKEAGTPPRKPQKISPAVYDSLKSRILLSNAPEDRDTAPVVFAAEVASVKTSVCQNWKTTASISNSDVNGEDNVNVKEHSSEFPSEPINAAVVDATSSLVDPPSQEPRAIKGSSARTGQGPKPRGRKRQNDDGMVLAAELAEDQICSQFSDEDTTESISSFGNAITADGNADGGAKNEGNNTKKLKQMLLAPLPESSSMTKGDTNKQKKPEKSSAKSTKNTSTTGKAPKQATLTNWLQGTKKV